MYYTYQGPRVLAEFEQFALNDKYKESEGTPIPRRLEGIEYWMRQVEVAGGDISKEVDGMFINYGLDETVPKWARLAIVVSLCCSPIVMMIIMLCCCEEKYPDVKDTKVHV